MILWATILASGVLTFLTRALPLVVTTRGPGNPAIRRYLDALPTAVIAALAGAGTFAPGDRLTSGAEPLAAIVVIALTVWRRNLLIAVLAGAAVLALVRSTSG